MPRTGGRILVTGASGFIGASLVRRLVAAGRDVDVLVRPGPPPARLSGLDGKYTAHRADLRDPDGVWYAVNACRPDVVFHLAAYGTRPGRADRTSILTSN